MPGMTPSSIEIAACPPFGFEQGFVEVDDDAFRFFSVGKEPLPILAEPVVVFFYVTGILPAVHGAFHLGQRRDAQVYGFPLLKVVDYIRISWQIFSNSPPRRMSLEPPMMKKASYRLRSN